MSRRARALMLVGVLTVAFLVAIFFVGIPMGSCLGPLGVTQVECIRATGAAPTFGPALPIIVGLVALAALVLFPVPRQQVSRAAIGGVAGAIVGTIGYLALHPTTMTGPTSTGEIITVQLPIDWSLLVAGLIAGAGVLALLAGHLRRPDAAKAA